MNKKVIKILALTGIFLFFYPLGNNSKAQNIDSLARKNIQDLTINFETYRNLANIDSLTQEKFQDLQISLENSKNLATIADLVITWSAMIMALFSIILVGSGFYTYIRFREINKIKLDLENLKFESENTLKKNKETIETINAVFENEKKLQMKLIFPLIKGENSFLQGDYYNAFYHYNEAKAISPNHPWLINFIWLLINSGSFGEAIRYLNNQLEKDPDNNDVKYYLAHVFRRKNDLDKAEEIIEPVATDFKHALSVYEYATILFLKGEYKKAEHMFREANTYHLQPDLFTYLNLAITQKIINKEKDAVTNGRQAKKLIMKELLKTPNNPHLILQLGITKLITREKDCVSRIKTSIKKGLQSENAKSALNKLKRIPNPTDEVSEVINLLQKYCSNI